MTIPISQIRELLEADGVQPTMADAPGELAMALLEKAPPIRDKQGNILQNGKPKGHLPNVQIVFEHDPLWAARFAWCELRQRVLLDGRPVEDSDEAEVVRQLARIYSLTTTTPTVHEAIGWAAARRRSHPVREWLERLEWDGRERLGDWLIRYCRAQDSRLVRAIGRAWIIQAVARAMKPGCKADLVLILQGLQGCRKSTTCKVLGGEWFRDSDIDLGSKDRYSSLEGAWIYELGELDAMRKADARALKAFVSSQTDSYRPAYGRNTRDVPRNTVFVGTTNDHEFLVDATGSRRFGAVAVGQCDPEALAEDRDQLFAEALVAYHAGEPWYLDDAAENDRAEQAEHWAPVDSWESSIALFISTRSAGVTLADVWKGALDNERINASRADDMRMGQILRKLGCVKVREARDGRREVLWRRE